MKVKIELNIPAEIKNKLEDAGLLIDTNFKTNEKKITDYGSSSSGGIYVEFESNSDSIAVVTLNVRSLN